MVRWGFLVALAGCGRLGFGDLAPAPTTDATATFGRSQLALPRDPGEPLADFPLLIVLDDQRAARDLMQPDASDLRFYDAAGDPLAYEIEQLGSPGGLPLVVWVRVPSITGTTTALTIDYGHASPPPPAASVWTPTYLGVWHLEDLADATTNHRDGVAFGGVIGAAPGMAGQGRALVGASQQAIVVQDDFAIAQALTVSGWISPTSLVAASGYACVISRQNGGSIADDFWLGIDNPTAFADSVVSVPSGTQLGTASHTVPLGAWSHLAMTYDGTTERLYVDGAQVSMTAVTGDVLHGAHPLLLGADHNSGSTGAADADFVDGALDEVRLEAIARTPAWLAYDDASMRDQLVTYGPIAP